MSGKGRKKRDPIFPDIDPEEEKEKLKTIRFYETEIKRIEEKLEERGKSFSNWVREKGEDLIQDRDLKNKIDRLESRKEKIEERKNKEIEEIDKKLREFRDQLEDREEVKEEVRRDIKEYITEEVRTGKTPRAETVKKELDEITQRFDISYKNRQEVRKIYFQEKSKVYQGDIKVEDLPDSVLDRWEEEKIVTLGVVD